MPRLTLPTDGFITDPNSISCRIGGSTSDMMMRRSRLIWFSSFWTSARSRCEKRRFIQAAIVSDLQLHRAHLAPRQHEEQPADHADRQHLVPGRRPAAALQEDVPDDLDVVARPDQVGEPAQRGWHVG